MSTATLRNAARRHIAWAGTAPLRRSRGKTVAWRSSGSSTVRKDLMRPGSFAFPKMRKESLVDARHVRDAKARLDQVEGVSDREPGAAGLPIRTAVRKLGAEVAARGWRQLMKGRRTRRSTPVANALSGALTRCAGMCRIPGEGSRACVFKVESAIRAGDASSKGGL